MNQVLRTDLNILASQYNKGKSTVFPLVYTSFCLKDGTIKSNSHKMTDGHIKQFNGIQIQFLNDTFSTMTPSIVLEYRPLTNIHITVVTP